MRIELPEKGLRWDFTPWLSKGNIYSVLSNTAKAVICVNENNERIFPPSQKIPYLWVAFNDPGEDLTISKLKTIKTFAEEFKEKGLLVHCFAGRNRSTTTCYYLMREFGMSLDDTKNIFKNTHSNIGIRKPLATKFTQLTGYEIPESWQENH